ncbi:SpoIIE family protein phosphatase [Kineococcus gynurae]|uniref:SpoIIE family protein phosphatase n=1 Tax=Kineococcus gynurae TaxID=452979 RepID=A0ABV5LT73_9ACTN
MRADGTEGSVPVRDLAHRYAALAARLVGVDGAHWWPVEDDGPAGLGGLTRAARAPLAVEDVAADPRTLARAAEALDEGVASFLGAVVRGPGGRTLGVLGVSDPRPRDWDGHLPLLVDLAAAVAGDELVLTDEGPDRAERVRRSLTLGLTGVGRFDVDLTDRTVGWDEQARGLLAAVGSGPREPVDDLAAMIHPDDRFALEVAVERCRAVGGTFDEEVRAWRADGRQRWLRLRGAALGATGTPPAPGSPRLPDLVGIVFDTTPQRREDDGRHALAALPDPFAQFDRVGRFRYLNAAAEQRLRRTLGQVAGRSLWEEFPQLRGGQVEAVFHAAVGRGAPVEVELELVPGSGQWWEVRAWPDPEGLSVAMSQATARRTAQREAEDANRRLRLLAAVTTDLTSTLDLAPAVRRFGQHLVPALGDWCVVSLLDDQDELGDTGWVHADPRARPALEAYVAARPAALPSWADRLVAIGTAPWSVLDGPPRAELLAGLPAGPAGPGTGAAAEAVAALDPGQVVLVPLLARQRPLGLLTVGRGLGAEAWTRPELQLLHDVAGAAALAIDNARLYGRQQSIAESLQRNLLSAPVGTDELQITVRYAPAAEAVRVGGDWYDVFPQADGSTVLVIGDVMGHDVAAAGSMGELRSLLRGTAYATGAGPADLLAQLDATVAGLHRSVIATVLVARLETDEDGTRLRWSSAGHPPMVRLSRAGGVEVVDGFEVAAEPDLLLGIDPTVPRTETVLDLDEGDVVLLFTDGLVERRDQAVDEGLERLAATVEELVASGDLDLEHDLDRLCDGLLARMLPERPEDDVALVAVRLLPTPDEDRRGRLSRDR